MPQLKTTQQVKIEKKPSPFGQLLDSVKDAYSKIGVWSETLQRDLPKKWEKHGDMIILPMQCFTLSEWRNLGTDNNSYTHLWNVFLCPTLWHTVAVSLGATRVGRKRHVGDDEDDIYRTPLIELKYGDNGWVQHLHNNIM